MNQGGDASEQVVRLFLQGTEVAVKLTGSGAKNVAAALIAVGKNVKKNKIGETRLTQLLSDGSPTKIFRLKEEALAHFKTYAKKYNIQYSAIREVDAKDGMCDVIIKEKDVARVNHVLGKMDYVEVSKVDKEQEQNANFEDFDSKKENQQGINSNTQDNKSMPKRADIKEVLKDIKENNKAGITPTKYKEYLKLHSHMYGYSQGNKKRILEQNPSASVVMSRTNWKNIGRFPKKDAEAILITMPEIINGKRTGKFVDAKVYDVADTYGKELSESNLAYTLQNNTADIVSEIKRIENESPVPIRYVKELETDSYYDDKEKVISVKDNLSQQDTYKALLIEQTHAQAHAAQGETYSRPNNILLAESTAFMVANKYGIDTSEYHFDYIPDIVNGTDGKDLNEIFDPVINNGSKAIKKADKHLEHYKPKEKKSVVKELIHHKDAIKQGIAGGDKTKVPALSKEKVK